MGKLHGTIAVSTLADGYGFIDPDQGGGQLLVRLDNIDSDLQLPVGEAVEYVLGAGSFAVEAVEVSPLSGGPRDHPGVRLLTL